MSEESLKKKTIKGVGWSAVDNVVSMGITFIVSIVLARLLTPDDYGLIGILTIFISVFNAIVDSGFKNALIRKKNAENIDYCTVFYTNLVLSVFLAFILYLCARPIANFFGREELVLMTQVMSSIVVINAFAIVQNVHLTRNINFKTHAKITFITSVVSGIIGIFFAYNGFGVWALVIQQITYRLFMTLLLWFFIRWIPSMAFSFNSLKEMWSFGWKLLVSTLIATLWNEIYQVVVGKCYSPQTLGLYTRAKQFSQLFSSNLTSVIQRVSFPVLSSIQDDRKRLKFAYQRIIRNTMLPTFVLMIGMAACAKPMVLCLIGEKWLGCVTFLQLICFAGMLYPLHAINLNMLQVQGRSDLYLRLEIFKKIIALGPLLLGIFVSIYWMVAGSVLTSLIAYYLNAYYSGPFLNYSIKDQIKDILPSFGVALTMAIPVFLLSFIPASPYIIFPFQIIVGAIVTILISEKLNLPEYHELKGIVLPVIRKVLHR